MRLHYALPFLALAAPLFFTRNANAQVHWDAGLDAGIMNRIATSTPTGPNTLGLGPIVGLHAHVALMPLLRLGVYATADVSPSSEPTARRVYSGGLRLKITPPNSFGPDDEMHGYIFFGFGYAGVYAPSYQAQLQVPDATGQLTAQNVNAPHAGGHFWEIPVGVGASWRFRKPWELTAELSARLGIANSGTIYNDDGRPATVSGNTAPVGVDTRIATPGQDSWAVGLTVGIGFDL